MRIIAKYKFDQNKYQGFIPTFNNEFMDYTATDEKDADGYIIRTIKSNSLPTQIKFDCYGNASLLNVYECNTSQCTDMSNMFNGCLSLRSVPEDFIKEMYHSATIGSYCFLYYTFNRCIALDEIKGLYLADITLNANTIAKTFDQCCRVKDIIFATQEDGTPYSRNCSNQAISLTYEVGYIGFTTESQLLNYNSGITADKKVFDDASYAALKNDPDWYTTDTAYSRYNHDSAVNTINSLPDVSQGTGNTIKFKGEAGSKTDGGAINTLTEEEIAVAAAKGWTVTFA